MKFILVILFASGFLLSCESVTKKFVKDPEVNVTDVRVTDINMSNIFLSVKMNVKNPNSFALNVDKIKYELNLSGENVTEGTFTEGIQIPAAGQGVVTVPLKFSFKSVGNILSGLVNRSFTKEYELKGTAELGIFSIPFTKKGEINLNQQ